MGVNHKMIKPVLVNVSNVFITLVAADFSSVDLFTAFVTAFGMLLLFC